MYKQDHTIVHELEKLYQYLYGAHHATNDDECSQVLHTSCHKLDQIIQSIRLYHAKNPAFIASN